MKIFDKREDEKMKSIDRINKINRIKNPVNQKRLSQPGGGNADIIVNTIKYINLNQLI